MKVTADKEHLRKVIDRADYAMLYSLVTEPGSESQEAAKEDFETACNYFTFLGVKVLEDEGFAEDFERTVGELLHERNTPMEDFLFFLRQFVRVGRWIRFDPPDNPGVEELEKDLERFFSAAPLEEIRETMKSVRDYLRSPPEKELGTLRTCGETRLSTAGRVGKIQVGSVRNRNVQRGRNPGNERGPEAGEEWQGSEPGPGFPFPLGSLMVEYPLPLPFDPVWWGRAVALRFSSPLPGGKHLPLHGEAEPCASSPSSGEGNGNPSLRGPET